MGGLPRFCPNIHFGDLSDCGAFVSVAYPTVSENRGGVDIGGEPGGFENAKNAVPLPADPNSIPRLGNAKSLRGGASEHGHGQTAAGFIEPTTFGDLCFDGAQYIWASDRDFESVGFCRWNHIGAVDGNVLRGGLEHPHIGDGVNTFHHFRGGRRKGYQIVVGPYRRGNDGKVRTHPVQVRQQLRLVRCRNSRKRGERGNTKHHTKGSQGGAVWAASDAEPRGAQNIARSESTTKCRVHCSCLLVGVLRIRAGCSALDREACWGSDG